MPQVKYGVSNQTAICEDITALPHETLETLDCGDFIIESNGNQARAFRVSKKVPFSSAEMTYADSSKVVSVSYSYNTESKVWEYEESEETNIEGATKVVANPTLSGNENALSGIEINEEKYKVGMVVETIGNPAPLVVNGENDPPTAQVSFALSSALANKIKSSKAIIFTMNNSFILTPLAQSGDTLACQSFAFDSGGQTMVARVRFSWNSNTLIVSFDTAFATAVYTSGITPYALLLSVN